MKVNLKNFWEKGYMLLNGIVPADTVEAALVRVENLNYDAIFKELYSNEYGEYRMQAPFTKSSIKVFKDLKNIMKNTIDKAIVRWIAKQWAVIKSFPGGTEQEAYHEFPGFETCRARAKFKTIQAGAIIGMIPETKLIVHKTCFAEADPLKRWIIEFGPDDCLIFRDDLVHAGASFDIINYRIHCTLVVEGIKWEENVTEAAPLKAYKCAHCPFFADASLKVWNHARFRANNPKKAVIVAQYRAQNDKSKICEKYDKHFEKLNSYYKHLSRSHKRPITQTRMSS